MHNEYRLSLFTPYRVLRGPPKNAKLELTRKTCGTFKSGETFEVEDEWSGSASAHRFLKDAWVGSTEFHVRESDSKS